MFKPNHFVALFSILAACAAPTGLEEPIAAASAASSRASAEAAALDLRVPERGFQLDTTSAWIDPGDDVRMCEVVALPGTGEDTYYVPRIEAMLGAQGAELVVLAAKPGSGTEAMMEPGASVPCTRAGEEFGEELAEVVSMQEGYLDERFPETTGLIFRGGQKLALEVHYVNESAEAVPARAKLSFHLADADRVQRTARSAKFENLTIYTPPRGRSSHVGECLVREEMLVSELVRRTQRYGTDFRVWFAGGARDGELAWDSQDRSDRSFEPSEPLHLLPGEGFRFECTYHNTSTRELRFGVSSADETCALQAKYSVPGSGEESDVEEGCLLFDVDPDGVARR
jgi:hypothetical protein